MTAEENFSPSEAKGRELPTFRMNKLNSEMINESYIHYEILK